MNSRGAMSCASVVSPDISSVVDNNIAFKL